VMAPAQSRGLNLFPAYRHTHRNRMAPGKKNMDSPPASRISGASTICQIPENANTLNLLRHRHLFSQNTREGKQHQIEPPSPTMRQTEFKLCQVRW
jgi:hypothetical protein